MIRHKNRFIKLILQEVIGKLNEINENSVSAFIKNILKARKIYVTGTGRVRFIVQCFAKRLGQLGFECYVVGETTTPPITKNDLLIAGSGSGETLTTVNVVKLAMSYKAMVNVVTTSPNSTLAKLADELVVMSCKTKLSAGKSGSVQPLNTLFEQCLFIFFDIVVLMLKNKLNVTEAEMKKRHFNLE